MSKTTEITTINIPKAINAKGSDKEITIDPIKWEDVQGFSEYLLSYACGVILQRASAGKNDDPEKAAKAVEAAILRLQTGIVPSGGGFTKLSPTDYALKEVLTVKKVKFEKGESVSVCINRLATKLTPEVPDEDTESRALAIDVTVSSLISELESTEVYKSALKARLSKAKTAKDTTGLLGQL